MYADGLRLICLLLGLDASGPRTTCLADAKIHATPPFEGMALFFETEFSHPYRRGAEPVLKRGISLMPAQDIYDPRRWRSRAKEMRVLAEGMYNTKTWRIVTRLADGWDKMADRAERRAANPARYLD